MSDDDTTTTCSDCGKNHLEELERDFPMIHYLRKVERAIRDEKIFEELPEGLSRFGFQMIDTEMDDYIREMMSSEGMGTRQAVHAYASLCLEVGVLIGNMTRHQMPLGPDFPWPAQEEISREWQDVVAAHKRHEEQHAHMKGFDNERALEVLKREGLIPEDAKVSVIGVDISQLEKLAAEKRGETGDERGPGMYL